LFYTGGTVTFYINIYWGVTLTYANLVGNARWEAKAWAFRRDNYEKISVVHIGIESTMNAANEKALFEAKKFISTLAPPDNWDRR
jgi:hypothetical protein